MQTFFLRKRPGPQARLERVALDVFHHQVGLPVFLGEVVDRHDVGVLETGDGFGLALESLLEVRVLQKDRMQNLDGDIAIEGGVIRLVDRRHTALAELLDDPV